MARKAISSNLLLNESVNGLITAAVGELLTEHAAKIIKNVDDSDDKKGSVALGVEIDCSESAPTINVKIRFSSSVTDRRTIQCDDPNQTSFHMLTEKEVAAAATPLEKGKRKASKRAAEAAEQAGEKASED